jgi:excisionase family DNA binding protein
MVRAGAGRQAAVPAAGRARALNGDPEPRVYTADEAAAILKCEAIWLTEKARARQVPYLDLAGSCLFTGAHLAAIIAMHEVLPDTRAAVTERRPALAWTTAEAAELLRCKPSWLQEKARRREIPYTMLGGAYHFSDAHLAEVIRIFEELPRSAPAPAAPASRSPRTAPDRGQPTLKARPPRKPRGRNSDRDP